MASDSGHSQVASCQCGGVMIEGSSAPLLAAICYCASCQRAGLAFEQMTCAPPILDGDGGTPFIVYRKDRVRVVRGREHLEARKLKPESPTRRIFATCCNSAMFADFTKGHWLSLYRKRFASDAPPAEMRVMTSERRTGVVLGNDMPNHARHSGRFLWRLICAWAAMGFRRPDIGLGQMPQSSFDDP